MAGSEAKVWARVPTQLGSTTTSSSVKAMISPVASVMPRLRA